MSSVVIDVERKLHFLCCYCCRQCRPWAHWAHFRSILYACIRYIRVCLPSAYIIDRHSTCYKSSFIPFAVVDCQFQVHANRKRLHWTHYLCYTILIPRIQPSVTLIPYILNIENICWMHQGIYTTATHHRLRSVFPLILYVTRLASFWYYLIFFFFSICLHRTYVSV